MRKHNVGNIIFSSSAAVYGEPRQTPMTEEHRVLPVNAYGINHISLRYLNAAGAAGNLGEDHHPETHLIPVVLKAALANDGSKVKIFGSDYPTPDGTCVRDYVHVRDIAQAHVLALNKLQTLTSNPAAAKAPHMNLLNRGRSPESAYNLGNGEGYSVRQVIEAARKITGAEIPSEYSPRRAGDPAVLVASSTKTRQDLGWQPQVSKIDDIIGSAWEWLRKHPGGYNADG